MQGMTILHYIVWSSKSDVQMVRKYVENIGGMASVMVKDNKGRRPLHLAAQRGNAAIVVYILSLEGVGEADVNHKDILGLTPMHYAAESKRTEVLDLLKSKGGWARARDSTGRTVLHHAVLRGHLSTVKKLVDLGCAVDMCTVDDNGLNPLDLARRKEMVKVVEFLEEQEKILRINIDSTYVAGSGGAEIACERSMGASPQMQGPSVLRYQTTQVKLREWNFAKTVGKILFVLFVARLCWLLEAFIRFRS